jgi:glycine/D-amino acid oxidase-like deaminating enzyme
MRMGPGMAESFDVIIIGGGIIGSSIAYNLAHDGFDGKIAVFEKDPTYEYASTPLSNAGIRESFGTEINIRISMYALGILRNFEEEMSIGDEPAHIEFKNTGYLFIATDKDQMSVLKKNHIMQKKLGTEVELITPNEILNIIPDISLEDILGASFGRRDGHLDPWGFLQAYFKKGKSMGVDYIFEEVTDILIQKNRVTGVKTRNGDTVLSSIVIDAAGPWAAQVGEMAGIELPVVPLRRIMFFFKAPKKFEYEFPLVIEGAGLVWRNETDELFYASRIKEDDSPGFDFSVDNGFFNEVIWPELAYRLPLFNTLKLVKAYSGHYCVNTIDGNAIVGQHPELTGFYFATGFSGHGLQQAPAMGKGLSELIRFEKYETIDLTPLRFERFEMNELVVEESFLHERLEEKTKSAAMTEL